MNDASISNERVNVRLPVARGVTLVEMIITMAVMGIIMAVTIPLFTFLHRGFTSVEVGSVLPTATQKALNKLQARVVESRRQFDRTVGPAFLACLPALSPPRVGWSLLPVVSSTMSLSMSSGTFIQGNVGDSLFFASTYEARTLPNGVGGNVRIDTFMFNHYYLAESQSGVSVGGKPALELWEWHSVPFADYQQLNLLPVAKSTNAVVALRAPGPQQVLFAWDSSSNNVAAAFYLLNVNGTMTLLMSPTIPTATLQALRPSNMLKLITGAASGGFKFGVSRNTVGGFTHPNTVPLYAQVSGEFPAGLEVMIVGPPAARQIFVRLVTAAQGNFKGYKSFQNVLVLAARDIY